MTQDAMSEAPDNPDESSAIEDETAQLMLAEAVAQAPDDPGTTDDGGEPAAEPQRASGKNDKLGDSGKRALTSERAARREAEKRVAEMQARLQEYEDAQKSELQKAQETAQRFEQELVATRVANNRLMAAAMHNIPPDLIDLLGDGTEEQIDARAKQLADALAAAAPAASEPARPAPAATRPVESLTPGAQPVSDEPDDPNAWLRRMAGRAP